MTKSVQELEADLAAARQDQADRDREAREAERAKVAKKARIDALRRWYVNECEGLEHLSAKIKARSAKVQALVKRIEELEAAE